jgi:hypothetical protein
MEFTLVRKYFQPTYTIGKLFIDDDYICDSIEDKVRPLKDLNNDGDFDEPGEGKIYAQTAIPYGRYQIKMVYWERKSRLTPQLLNVPGFTGIYIHSGTTASDTAGCLIFGENRIKGGVTMSRFHVNQIESMIRKGLKDGDVYITIR